MPKTNIVWREGYVPTAQEIELAQKVARQLDAIDWKEFAIEVQRKTRPLVEAYAEARRRSRENMFRRPPLRAALATA